MAPAWADHNNPPVLPLVPNVPGIQQVLSEGTASYCLDARLSANYTFRQQLAQVAQAGKDTQGIPAEERPCTSAQVRITAPTDQEFMDICGQGAAGCIVYWTKQQTVYLRFALGYAYWQSTCAHEGCAGNTGHALGQHEEYDDRNFKCLTDRTWTIMSCGVPGPGGIYLYIPQTFDVLNVYGVVIPDLPSEVGHFANDQWFWVQYNGKRADKGYGHSGNPSLDNVTRVAIFFRDVGSDRWWWTGLYGPAAPVNSWTSVGLDRAAFCTPGREYGIRPENALEITYLGNVPYVSGQVASAGFCP